MRKLLVFLALLMVNTSFADNHLDKKPISEMKLAKKRVDKEKEVATKQNTNKSKEKTKKK